MQTQIERWGDNLVVRIPESILASTGFVESSAVDVECVRRGQIIIRSTAPSCLTLDELINGITDQNLHREVDVGAAVGAEVW